MSKMAPAQEKKKSEDKLRWCNKILEMRVLAISKEFIANKTVKPEKYTTTAYDKHADKNRYNDILCIDATRVILKDRPADEDYIHASWMTMPDGQKYICTQGPVGASLDDFWHMMITEKSNVIVMLMAVRLDASQRYLVSEGNSKCTRYCPLDKAEEYGPYKVSLKEKKDNPFPGIKYQVLEATGGSGTSVVHHFIYDTWTDHTAPDSAAPAIGLYKLVKKLAAGAPITVHSSAGIGRTATFVGIDYASQKISVDGNYKMAKLEESSRSSLNIFMWTSSRTFGPSASTRSTRQCSTSSCICAVPPGTLCRRGSSSPQRSLRRIRGQLPEDAKEVCGKDRRQEGVEDLNRLIAKQ